MRRILFLVMLCSGFASSTAALAEDHCERSMRDWQPREAAAQKIRDMGIELRRIRTDDGCYKIYGRAADGRLVEIEMDPVTLDILETEYRDKNHHSRDGHHEREKDDDEGNRVGSVPANPLIGPTTGNTN